jgi:hypothetical protein
VTAGRRHTRASSTPTAPAPEPRTMFITVAGRRRDAYTDAADRKRAKARHRQRKFRRHRKDDGDAVVVRIVVDYYLADKLREKRFLNEWQMEAKPRASTRKGFRDHVRAFGREMRRHAIDRVTRAKASDFLSGLDVSTQNRNTLTR